MSGVNGINGIRLGRQNTHYMMFFYEAFSYWSQRPDSPTPDCKGCRKARPPYGGPERVRRGALESGWRFGTGSRF